MSLPILLITPPFTQLNTPYPATAYLKGFLQSRGIAAAQADLGLEVLLQLFSETGLEQAFQQAAAYPEPSPNALRMLALKGHYLRTIEPVVRFLQGKDPTLSRNILTRRFLPEGSRFDTLPDLEAAFGDMGIADAAKYLATLYLEDLSDLITETVDPQFGFSRYAERLSRTAPTYDPLYEALAQPPSFIDLLTIQQLGNLIEQHQPCLVALSVPFPGNLFSALRCGQWLRKQYPQIKTVMGGGYPNTELRSLKDPRIFEVLDFICLDDGEAPLEALYAYVSGTNPDAGSLKRTYTLREGEVQFIDSNACSDYAMATTGTPDYTGLPLDQYISVIEVTNPMHSLWSDGRWNKLTMAHGCYWGKCTFCDTTLPYISDYEPLTAGLLADRMETIIAQTGNTGFHFVDEAAPPALMRNLALEIIRRGLVVSWWANIRFEKSFTPDLCLLLREAGCIAVSGGLEVASDRLLKLIDKGVTVAQVARVNKAFTDAGILVHAYLMYGFPTQTAVETVDSMEMVRQLFAAGVLKSAFWHRFALTAHSPVGKNPDAYGVRMMQAEGTFANNDIAYEEAVDTDHDAFGYGLKKSLFNYMHGIGLQDPLHKWFDHKVPRTTVKPDWIYGALEEAALSLPKETSRVVWLGGPVAVQTVSKSKKGATWEEAQLTVYARSQTLHLRLDAAKGLWLSDLLPQLTPGTATLLTRAEVRSRYEAAGWDDFELFWDDKPLAPLRKVGLLQV
ncbi:MAG: radical SAM protein [Sphingobacteriales bacterium]|nr:MAG: radical SAM protein [Sphingobacteriales bacterium]